MGRPAGRAERAVRRRAMSMPAAAYPQRALAAAPYLVLLLGVALTAWGWWGARTAQLTQARVHFDGHAAATVSDLRVRLASYELILRSGAALFAASDRVTRENWASYVRALRIEQNYPGVQGIGVSFRVRGEELDAHLKRVRVEGLPSYSVFPEGARAEYQPLVYIEPFSGRNRDAVGFDQLADPVRAVALAAARDTGDAAITGKLGVERSTGVDPQPGFIMYVPLYARGMPVSTEAERRDALIGYVGSPFRVGDFLVGVLGRDVPELQVRIYDGALAAPEALVYGTGAVRSPAVMREPSTAFRRSELIPVGRHEWTVEMEPGPAFEPAGSARTQYLVVAAGTLFSLLMFRIMRSLIGARSTALRKADEAIARLQASEDRYALAVQGSSDGLWDWNLVTGEVYYSPRWKAQIGYREDEIGPAFAEFEARVHPDDIARVRAAVAAHLDHRVPYSVDFRLRSKDGNYRWIRARGMAIRDATGKAVRMAGSHLDISEYKAQQAAIERLNAELEARVAERTEQLGNANADLEREIAERRRAEQELTQVNSELSASMARMEHYTRDITMLGELGDLLHTCKTSEEAYAIVSQYGQTLFDGTSGGLFMITPSRNLVDSAASWGRVPPEDNVFAPDDCWALRRGKVNLDEGGGLRCHHVSQAGAQCSLCIPLVAYGETMGILHLRAPKGAAAQSRFHDLVHLAEAVAEHVGLAIATLRLRDTLRTQSIRDPLTGLFNRRYMEETLQREERRAVRAGTPIGVIMLDIDFFKNINDTFGHTSGDAYLRELGQVMLRHTREGDIACRYGGEEFTVILPGASLEATSQRAEELRRGAAEIRVVLHGRELPRVTISAGVAAFPRHGPSWEEVLARADEALYRAKDAGRDRVVEAASHPVAVVKALPL